MHLRQLGLDARSFPAVLHQAATLLVDDRAQARREQLYAPGLAEYLDLVIALARLYAEEQTQGDTLARAAGFALRKSAAEEGRAARPR